MTICAHVFEVSKVHLWGLDGGQRLHRQLNEINKTIKNSKERFGWVDHADDLPKSGRILIFNGRYVFENRAIQAVIDRPDCILQYESEIVVAFIEADQAKNVIAHMQDPSRNIPDDITVINTHDLKSFDINLRRSTKPLLEPVSRERKSELENKLYGNAYRGITDLVTKFV